MEQPQRDRLTVQLVAGIVVAALGVLFTLDNLGVLSARDFLRYWPVVLIAFGLTHIVMAQTWARALAGLVLVFVGSVILVKTLRLLDVDLSDLFPLLLVLAGGYIVWQSLSRGAPGPPSLARAREAARKVADLAHDSVESVLHGVPSEADRVEAQTTMAGDATAGSPVQPSASPSSSRTGTFVGNPSRYAGSTISGIAVLGGFRRRVKSGEFRGGELTAFMGGCMVDLRDATPAGGEAVINVFAVMGGIDIKVPDTWNVVIEVFPFLGGVEDKTRVQPGGSGPRLIVRGFVMMGGVEVKN